MQSTKLISLLKTFSKEELRDFEKFINSPFHSQKRDVASYFNAIKKHYPSFDDPEFTKQNLFKFFYPKEKYDEARIRTNNSFLYKTAKEFLVQLGLRENKVQQELLLLKQFRKRNLNSSFEGLAETAGKEIRSDEYPVDEYFVNRLEYFKQVYEFNIENNNISNIAGDIGEIIDARVGFFLGGYLRNLLEETVLNIDYGPELNSPTLERMKNSLDLEKFFGGKEKINKDIEMIAPLFYIYKTMRSLVETAELDTQSLNEAKKLFFKNIDRYSRAGKFLLFDELLNVYNVNTRYGKRDLISEEFELIKLQLKYNAFTSAEDIHMKSMGFRNILLMGLDLKEFEWTEEFIRNYSKYLQPEQRGNLIYYAMAILEYRRGNAGKALENSVKVKYDNFIFKRDLKLILLRLFYEQRLLEQARYFLNTSKRYNKSTDELSELMKDEDRNFMFYYGKLLNLNDKPDKNEAQMLLSKLGGEKKLTHKAWLGRQLEGLSSS